MSAPEPPPFFRGFLIALPLAAAFWALASLIWSLM